MGSLIFITAFFLLVKTVYGKLWLSTKLHSDHTISRWRKKIIDILSMLVISSWVDYSYLDLIVINLNWSIRSWDKPTLTKSHIITRCQYEKNPVMDGLVGFNGAWTLVGYLMHISLYLHLYIYIYISSHAVGMDFSDSLQPHVPIVHRFRLVFHAISCISIELL